MATTVTTGEGAGAGFVEHASAQFRSALGFDPFPGTLNLDGRGGIPDLTERMPWEATDHCDGIAYAPCYVSGVRAAVIRPVVPDYPPDKTEIIAPVRLREFFALEDGDGLSVGDRPWRPTGLATRPERLAAFDAVVFDFDGTLAELAVDWEAVQGQIAERLDRHMDGPLTEYDRRDVFRIAREAGVYGDVESLLTEAEIDAVPESAARDELRVLARVDCPVGICTANGSRPVRTFLEHHDVGETVTTIVARDTIPESKPDPRPLLRCIEELGVDPGNALFVGDERSDAVAAHRAGTSFLHPTQLGGGSRD